MAPVTTGLQPPPADEAATRELDELTLRRAQRGETDACRALIERYERPVFALLSRMLARADKRSLIEDLAQETFLRVFHALPSFTPSGPARPSTWILTIATHLALDELRRRQIVTFEPIAEIADLPVYGDEPTAADAAARNQELEILTKAIQSLPERCRQVLTLRKIYGLSQKEIAASLGIAEHTVEVQIANGMKRCAVFLARFGLP